jgi:hypothetical protein
MWFSNVTFGGPGLRACDHMDCSAHIEHIGGEHGLLVQIEKLNCPQRTSSRVFARSRGHEFTLEARQTEGGCL